MPWLLCYADSADNSVAGLGLIAIAATVVVVVGGLAFIPMALVWSRRRRPAEAIVGFAVLWGIVVCAAVIENVVRQQSWSREYTIRVASGYYDPNDQTDKPEPRWTLFGGCTVAYVGLLGWALTGKTQPPRLPKRNIPSDN